MLPTHVSKIVAISLIALANLSLKTYPGIPSRGEDRLPELLYYVSISAAYPTGSTSVELLDGF